MCEELISRKALLRAITDIDNGDNMDIYTNEVREIVEELPTIPQTAIKHFGAIECPKCGQLIYDKAEQESEENLYEWCHDCKEYDQENHCCHRYSSFIRETLQDNINAVLEDIKDEIKKLNNQSIFGYVSNSDLLDVVVEIIDNHISGKEKE